MTFFENIFPYADKKGAHKFVQQLIAINTFLEEDNDLIDDTPVLLVHDTSVDTSVQCDSLQHQYVLDELHEHLPSTSSDSLTNNRVTHVPDTSLNDNHVRRSSRLSLNLLI